MDTALNLTASLPPIQTPTPVVERAVTIKVAKLEKSDAQATLPSDKPFIAQAVAARLEGGEYTDPPSEIAPPERTLRPYDVPMLPFEKDEETHKAADPDPLRPDSTDADR